MLKVVDEGGGAGPGDLAVYGKDQDWVLGTGSTTDWSRRHANENNVYRLDHLQTPPPRPYPRSRYPRYPFGRYWRSSACIAPGRSSRTVARARRNKRTHCPSPLHPQPVPGQPPPRHDRHDHAVVALPCPAVLADLAARPSSCAGTRATAPCSSSGSVIRTAPAPRRYFG